MKKRYILLVYLATLALITQDLLPTALVLAETDSIMQTSDIVVYSDDSISLILKEDSPHQKVIEETHKNDGTIRILTLNKADRSITISTANNQEHYTQKELITIANNELGHGISLRSDRFVGFGSVGYNINGNNYYLKISKNGIHEKNVTRNTRNAGYLDAFIDAVNDIGSAEWQIIASLGWEALGALLSGGIGAIVLLTSSITLINAGKNIIDLTNRAHGYFWNA